MVTTCITYQERGYTTKFGYKKINSVLNDCKELYNAALQNRKEAWGTHKKSITWVDQSKELTEIRKDWEEREGSIERRVQMGVLKRIDKSFQGFFRRVKKNENPGYPRYKSIKNYRSIEIFQPRPQMIRVNKDNTKAIINIKGIPKIKVRLSRKLPNTENLVTLIITKKASGLWVSMCFKIEKEELEKKENAVGIDVGVSKRLTLSTGEYLEKRVVDRTREKKLRALINKAIKGSNNRKKKVNILSRESERNARRNLQYCHEITSQLVKDFGRIAVEDININKLLNSNKEGKNLNRLISDQTWGIIRNQLQYKAEWAGREFVKVDPKYTSQICHKCGLIGIRDNKKFTCYTCMLDTDADYNASINILRRAFGPIGGYVRSSAGNSSRQASLVELQITA